MKIYIVLLLSVCVASSYAGLGGAPAAPSPHLLSNAASLATSNPSTYTDLKRTLDSGTEVHEFLNARGTVFAVSWSGPFLPDLKELLGSHFQTLRDHVNQHAGGARSQVRLQQDDLVIFSGGRPGAFEGRAWIPSLLPAGFDTAAVK